MESKWKAGKALVERFQKVGRALLQYDIEDSHSGNIAMRYVDEETGKEHLLITATGSQKGDLEPNDICFLSTEETDYGFYKASSETDIHAKILSLEGINASIHAHTKDLVFVTFDEEDKPNQPAPFVPIDPLGHYHLNGLIPVDWVSVPSGSTEMIDTIPKRLVSHRVTLIQGHGAFGKARTIEEGLFLMGVANNSGYVVRMAQKAGVDVEALRQTMDAAPFMFKPMDYEINNDSVNEFEEEDELVKEFKKTGARIFESKISPFHTGSVSVRGINSLLYAPKAAMPRQIGGPLVRVPLRPENSDSNELKIHKAIYELSNFQTIAHCYVPEAEALSHFIYPNESEKSDRIVPIDAEGSFLYLVIPVTPPDVDMETLVRLLHDYKVVVVRGGGVWGAGHQSLSEVLHHPSSVREVCQYRIAAYERGLDLRKLEPKKAKKW